MTVVTKIHKTHKFIHFSSLLKNMKTKKVPLLLLLKKILSWNNTLTLPVPCISEEKKIGEIFIFTLFCGVSKGFMKVFKVFVKLVEAPQRSVKINISPNFFSSSGLGTRRVKLQRNVGLFNKQVQTTQCWTL